MGKLPQLRATGLDHIDHQRHPWRWGHKDTGRLDQFPSGWDRSNRTCSLLHQDGSDRHPEFLDKSERWKDRGKAGKEAVRLTWVEHCSCLLYNLPASCSPPPTPPRSQPYMLAARVMGEQKQPGLSFPSLSTPSSFPLFLKSRYFGSSPVA